MEHESDTHLNMQINKICESSHAKHFKKLMFSLLFECQLQWLKLAPGEEFCVEVEHKFMQT